MKNNYYTRVNLSRKMAYILRHGPEDYGIPMMNNGSVLIADLARVLHTSVANILEVADLDDKGRFIVKGDRIHAAHGHSFPVVLDLKVVETPGVFYHGTKKQFIGAIRQSGAILPMSRQFVHASPRIDQAIKVADRRKGDSVILEIDGNMLVNHGITVFLSEDDTLLTSRIPWDYVTNIIIL